MRQSPPEIVTLTYIEGPRSLQYQPGDVVFWVDGIERRFKSVHASELLDLVSSQYPGTISFDKVFDHFLAKYSIGSPYNREAGIHKIVHGLRQDLASAGLKMELVRNVRGLGYRLAEGWRVEPAQSSQSLVQKELVELRKLVHRCVKYVHERPIVPTQADLYYLDAEPHVVQENFMILDRVGWQLLHGLGDPKLVPEILDIKRDLSLLMSYVVFWRVGHRITPELWREDFEQETTKILGDLEMRLAKVQKHLRGAKVLPLATLPPESDPQGSVAALPWRR